MLQEKDDASGSRTPNHRKADGGCTEKIQMCTEKVYFLEYFRFFLIKMRFFGKSNYTVRKLRKFPILASLHHRCM
uniref:Uncharacterized protein n=1 Tax=Trichogramma kaykai TaxID=54128 RepID=A0ABD2W3K1_9HYME